MLLLILMYFVFRLADVDNGETEQITFLFRFPVVYPDSMKGEVL